MKNLNDYIAIYKAHLEKGDIQKAYTALIKYIMSLKAHFSKIFADKYSFGNVSVGYMDYTYFPFFDEFLREKKLRFGVVLNHEKMRFELWLMGQNAQVQKQYWELLKSTKWNEDRISMPKYSVLEVVLIENPDFNNLDILTKEIEEKSISFVTEIIYYLKNKD